jgi:hypothetical protein
VPWNQADSGPSVWRLRPGILQAGGNDFSEGAGLGSHGSGWGERKLKTKLCFS